MDEFFSQFLPSLGAAGPFCALAWWIINTQQKALVAKEIAYAVALAAKDARIEKLTDQVISLGSSTAQVLAELRAAVKGG